MWFVTSARKADTVILDEPDVYMHADLQRKLIRYVRRRFPQVIITTHSTEIMSEVVPSDIVVIDKAHPDSKRADTLPAVQRVLTSLGSAQTCTLRGCGALGAFSLWKAMTWDSCRCFRTSRIRIAP